MSNFSKSCLPELNRTIKEEAANDKLTLDKESQKAKINEMIKRFAELTSKDHSEQFSIAHDKRRGSK
jgi:hypothetical protein